MVLPTNARSHLLGSAPGCSVSAWLSVQPCATGPRRTPVDGRQPGVASCYAGGRKGQHSCSSQACQVLQGRRLLPACTAHKTEPGRRPSAVQRAGVLARPACCETVHTAARSCLGRRSARAGVCGGQDPHCCDLSSASETLMHLLVGAGQEQGPGLSRGCRAPCLALASLWPSAAWLTLPWANGRSPEAGSAGLQAAAQPQALRSPQLDLDQRDPGPARRPWPCRASARSPALQGAGVGSSDSCPRSQARSPHTKGGSAPGAPGRRCARPQCARTRSPGAADVADAPAQASSVEQPGSAPLSTTQPQDPRERARFLLCGLQICDPADDSGEPPPCRNILKASGAA